jgi:hypothetical protein
MNEGASRDAMLQLELRHERRRIESLDHFIHSSLGEGHLKSIAANRRPKHAEAIMDHLDSQHFDTRRVDVITRKAKRRKRV